MNRRLALLATGLACVLAMAGCSSSSPEAESSPSPTPSQSFAGPAMPSQAQGESQHAAQSFVGYWVGTLNYATKTGDTEGLKTLATKNCDACSAFALKLDQIYGKGGHVESQGWKIDRAVPFGNRAQDKPAFQLSLKVSPQKVYTSKNGKPQSFRGGDQPARIVLTRQDGHWLVDTLDI